MSACSGQITHIHASKYVICDRVPSHKIFLQHSLVAKCADLMLEEVNVVLIIPFITEVFSKAPDARHIFHSSGFCIFERLL